MARTALYAPAHIVNNRNAPGNTNQGPDNAPSLIYGGPGILDGRLPYNSANSATGAGVIGWLGSGYCLSAVPSTLTTTAIAAAQVPAANTPLTLVAATGAGITVLASTFQALPSLTVLPIGTLAIDGLPGYQRIGMGFITAFFDQSKFLARNIQIASVGVDTGGTFTVRGWDVYGFPMSETITGASGATASGKKAFKFVGSITPSAGLSGSNVSVGQGDVYGLPMRADQYGQVEIIWNALNILVPTNFLPADTTSPATATTGDVRGTYAAASASNNTKRLEFSVQPSAIALAAAAGVNVGLFGVVQA